MTTPKKVETWMPLLVDKYLGDTTHLSTEQHGAYLLLLFSMWKKGGALPTDENQLKNITKLTPLKWRKSRSVLLAFFREEDGVFTQKRLTAELSRAIANVKQKSVAGKASAEARKGKKKGNGKSTAVGTDVATEGATKPRRNAKPKPIPPSPSNGEGSDAVAPVPAEGRTVDVWNAYSAAYTKRYGVGPVRNRRSNSMLAQFVELVPADEAPAIAAHFVASNGGLYTAASHPINLLLRDAEKLRMEWKTGRTGGAPAPESTLGRERRTAASGFGSGRAAAPLPAAKPALQTIEAEVKPHAVARIS